MTTSEESVPPRFLIPKGACVRGPDGQLRKVVNHVKTSRWMYLLDGIGTPVEQSAVTRIAPDPYPAVVEARPAVEGTSTAHLTTEGMGVELCTPTWLEGTFVFDRKRRFPTAASEWIKPAVTYGSEEWDAFGRLSLDNPVVNGDGVSVTATIRSNPEHFADPHDMVTLRLERDLDKTLDAIAVVTPGKDRTRQDQRNVARVAVTYSWEQLARLLDAPAEARADPARARAYVEDKMPRPGLRADWYVAARKGAKNTYIHRSGGADGKGHTGLLRLRPLTPKEYADAAVNQTRTEWNLSEDLTPDRPVYAAHSQVLQIGREMATTIEAEAEYVVTDGQLTRAIGVLELLVGAPAEAAEYGIRAATAHGVKETHDTYYDTAEHDLLKKGIVLRRRHVSTDPEGTFLFAVKGGTVTFRNEPFRLASQVHLSADPVTSPEVAEFCLGTTPDNAFAAVLRDALGPQWGDKRLELRHALTVHSTRVKFSLQLDNATTIEFSADTSHATTPDGRESSQIHCLELGVGHPGLFVADAAAGGPGTGTTVAAQEAPLFTRTYHLPKDLVPELSAKADFRQFTGLRGMLVPVLLGPDKTTPGGNKAQMLARDLKLFT
ncbi:CYTH domain-containing protein [Streptomyces pimonensis]|uniref:CYTH domain-containing protein n=1 Tax=Streptomyces pimonensis TaxID=2860288 RepID=A0ABV4IUM2_9ACTN